MRQTAMVVALLLIGSFLGLPNPLAKSGGIAPSLAAGQNKTAEIARIQAYHDQIDRWATSHPNTVQYLSTVMQDDNTSPWKAFANKRSLPEIETHASVWVKAGKVVAVILSQKTDHTNFTDGSYFREDGSLAYREIHSYSIGLDPPFRSMRTFYGTDGVVLDSKCLSSVDDRNRKPCSSATIQEMTSDDDMLFLSNTKLPFYSLITGLQ